jgi:phospholipid transport system transporter-binding protein
VIVKTIHFQPQCALTFNSVSLVWEKIAALLKREQGTRFCLDLSLVTHCDSAGLALLIQIKKFCQQDNKQFELKNMPEKTHALAQFCGVAGLLC